MIGFLKILEDPEFFKFCSYHLIPSALPSGLKTALRRSRDAQEASKIAIGPQDATKSSPKKLHDGP